MYPVIHVPNHFCCGYIQKYIYIGAFGNDYAEYTCGGASEKRWCGYARILMYTRNTEKREFMREVCEVIVQRPESDYPRDGDSQDLPRQVFLV